MDKQLLLGLIAGLGLALLLNRNKASDARSENLETKEKLLETEKELTKIKATIQIEESKREGLKKELTEKVNESLTPQDIADYFNRPK